MNSGKTDSLFLVLFFLVLVCDPIYPDFMAGPQPRGATALSIATTSTRNNNINNISNAETRLIVRKIKACETIQQGWEVLQEYRRPQRNNVASETTDLPPLLDELVAAELLNLCGKVKDPDTALQVVSMVPTSKICRSRAISILGTCGRNVDALNVLTRQPLLSSTGPYNSAIAASGKAKDWQAVLCILQDMPNHLVTTVTLNAALTAMRKAKRPTEAWTLLKTAANASTSSWPRAPPDRVSYHTTLSCLLEHGDMDQACRLVRDMERAPIDNNVQPNGDTYSRLSAAVTGYPERWEIVQQLLTDKIGKEITSPLDFQKWSLKKCGRGKNAYWELGTLYAADHRISDGDGDSDDLLVALQPNRNPAVNGMKLAFYRPSRCDGSPENGMEKLGYLLMINSHQNRTSQFLGQFVDEACRGQGLAKIWLAVWFRLCLDAGLRPVTGKIRKPLLCLVLESSFGMIPQSGGVEAVLSPGEKEGEVVLYSPGQSLEGAVSPLDLRHQNIRLSSDPPDPPGRTIVLNCDFIAPDTGALEASVAPILQDRFILHELVQKEDLCQILLGT